LEDLLGKCPETAFVRNAIINLQPLSKQAEGTAVEGDTKWYAAPFPLKLDEKQRLYGGRSLLDLMEGADKSRNAGYLKRLTSDDIHEEIAQIVFKATQIPPTVLNANKIPKDELRAKQVTMKPDPRRLG